MSTLGSTSTSKGVSTSAPSVGVSMVMLRSSPPPPPPEASVSSPSSPHAPASRASAATATTARDRARWADVLRMRRVSAMPPLPRQAPAREVGRDPIGPPERTEGMWDVSDEALFAGFASGGPAAAAAFVRRLERKVYGLALAIVGDPGDAQDVAQEAFVRAWRFADSF